jgi:hypothetical protein
MMKNTRLGCFTTTGIMAAVLTLLIVTGFAFASGGTLFSPGTLNARTGAPLGGVSSNNARAGAPLNGVSSHAEIAGKCSLCHVPFWSNSTMAERCVVCHTDVAAQWVDPATLHGTLSQNNPNLDCRNCHPDHRGPDSPLIDLSKANFPHTTFGFLLTAHQLKSDGSPFSCNDCHSKVYTRFDQNICTTCHFQMDATFVQNHVLDFGIDCLACHDGADTYGKNFDHNGVPFQLTEKHALLECAQCHVNTRNIADLKTTSQDCVSCHAVKDVHQNRLGSDCSSCHTTAGWTPASFDHNLSVFKLDGLHANIACADCHVNHVLQGTPADCNSCHAKKDVHQGRLGPDCGSCHSTDGWTPAKFNHNLSIFKLTGQHATAACADCHINNVLQGTPTDCYACHSSKDTHKGALGTTCNTCHNAAAWKPAFFDHNLSTFKLTGQHAPVTCLGCHANNVFKGTPSDCNSCHAAKDTHNGNLGTNCGSCHSTTSWTPTTFNHNLATFKLTGQHINITCASCHVNNVFWGTPADCHSCHVSKDTHNGQLGSNCGKCHSTSAWLPATFDHNLSGFKLTGQHVNVACTSCHNNNVFNGTPTSCNSCHASQDSHNGQFGTNCGSCHSTSGWTPATFDHNLSSFKLTGAHTSVNCNQCHTGGNFSGLSSTCAACHAEPAAHFGTDCAQCHSTNNWNASYSHTGFPLTGAHSSLNCTQCHTGGSYSGLSSSCVSCHAEPSGHYGTNCAQCHSTSNWNATFSHPSACGGSCTDHHRATCADCHPVNNSTYSCLKCHDSNKPGN